MSLFCVVLILSDNRTGFAESLAYVKSFCFCLHHRNMKRELETLLILVALCVAQMSLLTSTVSTLISYCLSV